MPQTNLYLNAYDISADRVRGKCSALLEDLGGRRINKSVFEVLMPAADAEDLMLQLSELLAPTSDSVACYPVCHACYGRAWWWPEAPGPWPDAVRSV